MKASHHNHVHRETHISDSVPNLHAPLVRVDRSGPPSPFPLFVRNEYLLIPNDFRERDLIIGMEVALQRGGLKIAAGLAYGETLVREMESMEVRVTAAGHEQFGAWREGTHDDLVFGVALACWCARKTGAYR